eukprot:gene7729-biopygen5188
MYVADGADIMYRKSDTLPTFIQFACAGRLDCFEACMDTPHPIDFTRGYFRWSIYSLESGHEFSFSPSGIFGVCMRRSTTPSKC